MQFDLVEVVTNGKQNSTFCRTCFPYFLERIRSARYVASPSFQILLFVYHIDMFPGENSLYKSASKVGFIIGITQILLSGFILRGYFNASKKVLLVYKEFSLSTSSRFTWGYASIVVLLVLGVFTLLFAFLLKKSKPETKGRYYMFLVPLLFLGIVTAFLCIYTFQRLVIYPVVSLPNNL